MVNNSIRDTQKKSAQVKQTANQKRKSSNFSYDRYQEVQEERFWKDRMKGNAPEIEEFQIDTRGTFADRGRLPDISNLPSSAQSSQVNTNTVVKASSKPTKSSAIPIIIVPSAITSLITLFNAKEFLQDGVFVSTVEKKNKGTKKESMITIERKKVNSVLTYRVIDNVAKLSPKDWENVVAAFALGAEWQFKGWPWHTVAEIFSRVVGFFLHYEDEVVPVAVKSWDVKILTISKQTTKKHLAQTAALDFWNSIDQFMSKHKSSMATKFSSTYFQ